MANNMRLYKVTCKGMTSDMMGTRTPHGIAYVLSDNPDTAYMKLKAFLDKHDFGTHKDRELDKVELIAEKTTYPNCGMQLFP